MFDELAEATSVLEKEGDSLLVLFSLDIDGVLLEFLLPLHEGVSDSEGLLVYVNVGVEEADNVMVALVPWAEAVQLPDPLVFLVTEDDSVGDAVRVFLCVVVAIREVVKVSISVWDHDTDGLDIVVWEKLCEGDAMVTVSVSSIVSLHDFDLLPLLLERDLVLLSMPVCVAVCASDSV